MKKKPGPNYRWYILTLTALTYGVIAGIERMCMPVLFKQISVDLHLSVTAVGTIWGMDPLAGIFIGLPAGLLADRFGVKRTLTVVCILAGVFGALRGLSVSFFTMALTMFLFGFMAAATPSIIFKVTAEWFNDKRLGLANALLNVAWSIGAVTATLFSATVMAPWLHGWRNVTFLYGLPAVVLGLLWLFTGKEPERSAASGTAAGEIPFKQALSHVIRIKEVWLIGIINLFLWGASMGFIGYLPLYLRNNGWTNASADSAITVFNAMYLVGTIPMVLLSDKLKSRKGIILVSMVTLASGLAILPFLNVTGIWILLIICGFMRSGAGSLFYVMLLETKGIGGTYGGTATGLANTISMVGAFIAPPLGNRLDSVNHSLPFIFWGCLAAVGLPLLLMLKTEAKRV